LLLPGGLLVGLNSPRYSACALSTVLPYRCLLGFFFLDLINNPGL
jgi:hypothetical protein